MSSHLSIAIVGFPNVGKSTLFNALLKQQVALAANYPFATVDPNVGIVEVPDARLEQLAAIVNTSVIKHATVEFVDVAGLVKGASNGEGLGNQFLSHIRETSAICHVLRAFSDTSIIREGATEPVADLAAIRTELQLADLTTLEKQSEPKNAKDKALAERWVAVTKFREVLNRGELLNQQSLSTDEVAVATELSLLTIKPEIFAVNVDEEQLAVSTELQAQLAEQLQVPVGQVVVMSARIESELASLDEADQRQYLQDLGVSESGLERLARVAYRTLKLQTYLTAGEKEVRAWTIKQGSTAPQAAAVIHSDFEQHFIKAKVAHFQDFVDLNGWKLLKEKGKLRLEGRDYVMQEGDVVEFMIGT